MLKEEFKKELKECSDNEPIKIESFYIPEREGKLRDAILNLINSGFECFTDAHSDLNEHLFNPDKVLDELVEDVNEFDPNVVLIQALHDICNQEEIAYIRFIK